VLEKEIRELCKKYFPEEYRLLKSIPGIGDSYCCFDFKEI
jgi:adenine-specific DNA glycosylase